MTGKNNGPLIVTGMHRSGTSMIASYIQQLGINMGDSLLLADKNNQKGYFEDVDFLELQRTMLKDACEGGIGGWTDWGYTEDGVFNKIVFSKYEKAAGALISKRQKTNSFWGWKDPRTALLLDFWNAKLPDARYVLIYRNPWEVKKSMQKLNAKVFNDNPQYGFKIWEFYNRYLLDFYKRNQEKCILISANRFFQKPELLSEALKFKLEIKTGETKTADYSFFSSNLFSSEPFIDEINEAKQNTGLFDLLMQLHEHADVTGFVPSTNKPGEKKISIVIPCFNQGAYLPEALSSVEQNLRDNYEIIIVNDGSTDTETIETLKKLEEKNYKIIHQQNKGLAEARNAGIAQAETEYILPLDADNKIDAEYVNQACDFLDKNNDYSVVYANPRFFGERSEMKLIPDFKEENLITLNYIDACTVFRKEAWKNCGGYDSQMPVPGFEDWELWVNFVSKGYKFYHIKEFLFEYRVRGNSMLSNTNKPENREANAQYVVNKHTELYQKNIRHIFPGLIRNIAELDKLADARQNAINELHLHNEIVKNLHKDFEEKAANSIFWKLKLVYDKIKMIAKSPKANGSADGWSFYRIVKFVFSKNGQRKIRQLIKRILRFFIKKITGRDLFPDYYSTWRRRNYPDQNQLEIKKANIGFFRSKPKFSIILPVFDPPVNFLLQAIESVFSQVYTNWELCIADDCSQNPEVKNKLDQYAHSDSRIKVVFRKENGHISANSNSALSLATGDYIVLLDHDDMLAPHALYELAACINKSNDTDVIYSDEDKVDEFENFLDPHFKPDWCPDNLLSRNYIGHLVCIRRTLVEMVGGFREGFEGSQDYDLMLRVTEKTNNIFHIPQVLYHWRKHEESTADIEQAKPYAFESGERALREALERRKVNGTVKLQNNLPGFYTVRYKIEQYKKVSIIIPSKDQAKVLGTCLHSVFSKTLYPDFEVIVINNNSSEEDFFKLMKQYKLKEPNRFYCYDCPIEFNFSGLMNFGASKSNGDYLLLLNNDTKIIAGDWMEAMVEQAQRPSIGAVGVKLLYPNNTIQHAGVIVGLGGVAGHAFIGLDKDAFGYYYYITSVSNFSSVTAACMMVRKEVYEEVNGFTTDLAVEYNDVDFCLKVKEAGYNNIYLPHVEVYHYESLTRGHPHRTKESFERHVKEIAWFKENWQKYIDHDPCYSPNLTLDYTHFQIRV